MAYNRNDISYASVNEYDKLFHQNTGISHHNASSKKVQSNDKILNYRLFTGQYELNKPSNDLDAFGNFNENARKNREMFRSQESTSIKDFNRTIDNLHLPQDMQRPVATRDQIKGVYDDENKANKSYRSNKQANDYFNQHQFMPSRLGNKTTSGFDMYSMTFKKEKTNAYEEMF